MTAVTPDATLPTALREPARRVGNMLAAVAAAVGVLIALVQPLTDLVPGKYHAQTSAAIATATAITAALVRVSTGLVRGQVWSPASHFQSVAEAQWVTAVRTRDQVQHEKDHAAVDPVKPVTAADFHS